MIALLTSSLALAVAAPTDADRATADVDIILAWLMGRDEPKVFAGKFGDAGWITEAKDAILYTDVGGVIAPKGLRMVPYDAMQARLQRIRQGHKASPGVVVTRTSLEDPSEDDGGREAREVRKPIAKERYYYVEVGIGNLAWHWLKIAVGEKDGMVKAKVLWRKGS